jgi:hypothetical protein
MEGLLVLGPFIESVLLGKSFNYVRIQSDVRCFDVTYTEL